MVLLRPAQPTLGSLVLACKEDATSLGAVSGAAYAELALATADIERTLGQAFDFRKINYLALMMVDPHVHFHVIPRYSEPGSSTVSGARTRRGQNRLTCREHSHLLSCIWLPAREAARGLAKLAFCPVSTAT